MTATRFRADHLLTLEGDPTVVGDGVVDVAGGSVTWSGPATDAPEHHGPVERLAGLLIPGFVNTHAHTAMVLLRGAGEGLPVPRWLTEVMWPREGLLTPEDVWWGMTLGAQELLGNGITTSHEMYFHSGAVAEAASSAGLRAVVTPPILTGEDLTRFGTWQQQLDGILELADRFAGHDLVTVGLGPHSAYAVPEEPLRALAAAAGERGLHLHIHLAEAEHEGDGIMERYGVSVSRYLDDIGLLENPVVAAHGIWLSDADIALLSERGTAIAHCPVSNGKHASGVARVGDLRAAGVTVAVATDGPSSHDRLDMFEEMRSALRMARLAAGGTVLSPAEVLLMATRDAGRALGRPDLGTLSPGSRADMVLVDTTSLGPVVEPSDLITHLVYSGSPALVDSVWVGGRRVVSEGRARQVDVTRARAEVTARARRLAQQA